MRNADCSDSWVERSEWNAMRVLSLMSGKLCCFRMRVRASNRLFRVWQSRAWLWESPGRLCSKG